MAYKQLTPDDILREGDQIFSPVYGNTGWSTVTDKRYLGRPIGYQWAEGVQFRRPLRDWMDGDGNPIGIEDQLAFVTRERDKARKALKLVLALNRQPVSACVPKCTTDPNPYDISRFIVDLDPKAKEQIEEALQ